jgi:hypothetical protein
VNETVAVPLTDPAVIVDPTYPTRKVEVSDPPPATELTDPVAENPGLNVAITAAKSSE